MQTSLKIIHHNHNNKDLLDEISLSYEERFIRRKKLIANNGTEFLVNLKETVSVDENQFFELDLSLRGWRRLSTSFTPCSRL